MSTPKPPTPPDPKETAGAQTANNIGTAVANQVMGSTNQITPTGSLTYYITGPNGELIRPADLPTSGGNSAGNQNLALISNPQTTTQQVANPYANLEYNKKGGQGTAGTPAQPDTVAPAVQPGLPPQPTSGGSSYGGFQWTDPNTGQVFTIPQMTAVQELTPEEQAIFNSGQGTRQNLADLAQTVSGQMQDHFSTPFNLNGLPQAGSASNLTAPQFQQLSGNIAPSGSIHDWVNPRSDELMRKVEGLSYGVADAGEILREFGDAGELTRSYGPNDFSEDRKRVEEALMGRLSPYIDRDREAMLTRLANQGIGVGSEAFADSQFNFDRGVNDARLGAILSAGQEQARMVGMDRDRAIFQNAAQQQAYNQALGRGMFSNQGQQQQFGQNLESARLGNDAALAAANFANNATLNAFGMDLSARQFANQAQEQRFGQNLARAQFGNTATSANNALEQQAFGNDAFLQDMMNADRQRAVQERLLEFNQPINAISALMGAGQVQMPDFVNTNSPQIPTTDVAGLINDAYAQQYNAYANSVANRNSLLGGLFGAGATLLGAPSGSLLGGMLL